MVAAFAATICDDRNLWIFSFKMFLPKMIKCFNNSFTKSSGLDRLREHKIVADLSANQLRSSALALERQPERSITAAPSDALVALQTDAQTLTKPQNRTQVGDPVDFFSGRRAIPAMLVTGMAITAICSQAGAESRPANNPTTIELVDSYSQNLGRPGGDIPNSPPPITSPDQLGLDHYPTTDAARQQDNLKLNQLNLRDGSFKQTMLPDMQRLGLDNVDIWYGSNVQLNGANGLPADGGALYDQWSKLPGVSPRVSSHEHIGQEYQILTGDGNTPLLFGKDTKGNTYFQVEHNFAGGATAAQHDQDYQLYKFLNENVGAKGVSPHTDKNPIVLGWH